RPRLQVPPELHVEQRPRAVVARPCEQQLGLEARRVDARLCEHLRAVREGLADAQAAAVSSACRRSSAVRASVNSSSSPSRTRSRLCTVTFTRWSVTRFSGKLYVRIFSARSPEPICDRRVAACSAACLSRSSSYSRARNTRSAFVLF